MRDPWHAFVVRRAPRVGEEEVPLAVCLSEIGAKALVDLLGAAEHEYRRVPCAHAQYRVASVAKEIA